MSIKKSTIITMIAMALAMPTIGQTVQWSVTPDGIENASKPVCFRSAGKVGMRGPSGAEILPAVYDSITPFQGGYALAIQNVGKRGLIKALVREGDGDVTELAEELYATRYSFFSEGKMCVSDASRQQGFLSTDGNLIIPCQYKTVHPFSEGLASVTYQTGKDKENVYYINETMNEISVEPGYGEVIFGSSFVNDRAVVYTINRKGYTINRRGRDLGRYKASVEEAYKQARKSSFYAMTERTQSQQNTEEVLPPDPGYIVYEEGGNYGYKTSDGRVVVPAQFNQAEPFRGGIANVWLGDKNGKLRLIPEGSFSGKMEKTQLAVGKDGKAEEARFKLTIPEGLKDANLVLRVFDEQGTELDVKSQVASGEHRVFTFQPKIAKGVKSGEYGFYVGTSDKLFLWSDKAELAFNHVKVMPKPSIPQTEIAVVEPDKPRKPKFTAAKPRNLRKKADQNDNFPIAIQITNTGDANGMVTVTLKVAGKEEGKQRVNVKAGSSSQATISFKVKKEKLAAVVEAILDNGTGSKSEIDLKAFY